MVTFSTGPALSSTLSAGGSACLGARYSAISVIDATARAGLGSTPRHHPSWSSGCDISAHNLWRLALAQHRQSICRSCHVLINDSLDDILEIEHKALFAISGAAVALSGWIQWRNRAAPCPVDSRRSDACLRTRKASARLDFVSLGFYLVGGWFAFIGVHERPRRRICRAPLSTTTPTMAPITKSG